ncbi:hypothetical protein T484DRAFT_1898796, partial [Baffinella frigidus]
MAPPSLAPQRGARDGWRAMMGLLFFLSLVCVYFYFKEDAEEEAAEDSHRMAWRLAQKTAIAIPPTPLPKGGAARRDVAAGGGGEGTRRKKEGVAEVAVTVKGLEGKLTQVVEAISTKNDSPALRQMQRQMRNMTRLLDTLSSSISEHGISEKGSNSKNGPAPPRHRTPPTPPPPP